MGFDIGSTLFSLILVIAMFCGIYYYFLTRKHETLPANIINGIVGFLFLDNFIFTDQAPIAGLIEIIVYIFIIIKGQNFFLNLLSKNVRQPTHKTIKSNRNMYVHRQQRQQNSQSKRSYRHTNNSNIIPSQHSSMSSVSSQPNKRNNNENIDKLKHMQMEQIRKANEAMKNKDTHNSNKSNNHKNKNENYHPNGKNNNYNNLNKFMK